MKLDSLDIVRMPGLHPGFRLEALKSGVNVVVGPNASGKSSLVRALRSVLYTQELRQTGVHIEATFIDAEGPLQAHRLGTDLSWSRNGERIEAPPLPDHRFIDCYTLHIEDLLNADHGTEQEIGLRLARELAGGYDLPALRDDPALSLKTTHARSESQALTAAEQELRERRQQQRGLQHDEQRLTDLKAQRRQTQRATHEADQYERALDLLGARRQHRDLKTRMAALPPGLDKLRGDELQRLALIHDELRRLEHEQQQARTRLEDARQRCEETGLTDPDLDADHVDDQRPAIRRLLDLERGLEQATGELHEAQATLRQAAEGLGGTPETAPALDPATLHRVEQSLETLRGLQAGIAQREDELASLPATEDTLPAPDTLRRGRDELLHWLGAPRPTPWTGLRRAAAGIALLAAGGAIGTATALIHPAFAVLALPVAWGAYVAARPAAHDISREAARARFRDSGLAQPSDWQTDAVRERLAHLEHELGTAEAALRTAERRARLERELQERRAAREQEEVHLKAIARQVGFDPGCMDASLQRWIHLTANHDRACQAVNAARAEQERLTAELETTRAPVLDFLSRHSVAPPAAHPSADALAQRLDRLAARLQTRDTAQREEKAAQRELKRLQGDADRAREQIAALYAAAGLENDDEATLRERLRLWPDWQELSAQLANVYERERDRRRHLEDRPDLLDAVEADAADSLESQLQTLRDQAAERDRLSEEIARIEAAIDRAGHERQLEAARARRERARDTLSERLEQALFATAGNVLLDQIEIEHEQAVQPVPLRQAREWFQRFTRHQYQLQFSPHAATRFSARETASGAIRSLTELSSGTRMQLLLAVRMAFALEAERGRSALPLILDEALGTADPNRFRAVAESLQALAHEAGRQVFYLTAQPEDARYWQAQGSSVEIIDLAARRWGQQVLGSPDQLTLPATEPVPAPGSDTPEDYAQRIGGIPVIDPWQDPAGIHLFHLLRDRLELLQRLLELGVDRLGALESLLEGPANSLLEPPEYQMLKARSEATRVWIRAWRQGRGRPVDRAALEASEAVSATFIQAVSDLASQLNGDAEQLLLELEGGTVKRFQSSARERLSEWLSDNGYIDPNPVLTEPELEHRVIATLKPHHPTPEQAITEGQALARALRAGVHSPA
ncbi:AAA family ATPase [Thioalkalivibrio sp. ALJ16]|uniref:ATP-binding protein n=1 Tax=Thioalkalivibrio sp. ALJ16 TaxID=1158762 RepID=UPI00036327ED|nr:AAA family ATPase [Thioalkalivibrio sp. ALJ16]